LNAVQVQRVEGSAPFCGMTPTPSTALMASGDAVRCEFFYDKNFALLNLRLSLTNSKETVSLLHQVHVDNTL
jgi:hypothetical protein